MKRRSFLQRTTGLAAAAALAPVACSPRRSDAMTEFPEASTTVTTPFLHLEARISSPVLIQQIEVRKTTIGIVLRVTDSGGATGFSVGNQRHPHLIPIVQNLVAPVFLGQDARRLEYLIDQAYISSSNYKYAGMSFFNSLALVELAVWDLLARRENKPVHALLGPQLRSEVPAYLTRLTRATSPEQEVDQVEKDLATTGCSAVKVKIGGRMSGNADASPGRTEQLIPLLRKRLGADKVIYVDSNGSYDAPTAIHIGRMLESHDVAFYEEPCPFQEFEATREVADALDIPIAGGEQDTSLPMFSWMIRHRALDIVQPDLLYVGGMIRALRVARMAEKAGLPVIPHSPGGGAKTAYLLHFAAIVPNLGPHTEQSPHPGLKNGKVSIPNDPGWGFTWDPSVFSLGQPVFSLTGPA